MRVFLSWSGTRSYEVANALRDWLPQVLQAVEPWLSSDEIRAGSRWSIEPADALSSSELAIVCVTPENIESTWLSFEAGVATKQQVWIVPYLLDLSLADLKGPFAQFQAAMASRDDTRRLVQLINSRLTPPVEASRLDRAFELWWPRLEDALNSITAVSMHAARRTTADRSDDLAGEIQRIAGLLEGLLERVDRVTVPAPVAQAEFGSTRLTARPRVFIGSSSEGLSVALAIQVNLETDAECTVWNQGAFEPSKTTIESLVEQLAAYDFAIIVLTPDDLIITRGETASAPRDNLIFELGLFVGGLGRARTFMVLPQGRSIQLPSDLMGVTAVTYVHRADENLIAATAPLVCAFGGQWDCPGRQHQPEMTASADPETHTLKCQQSPLGPYYRRTLLCTLPRGSHHGLASSRSAAGASAFLHGLLRRPSATRAGSWPSRPATAPPMGCSGCSTMPAGTPTRSTNSAGASGRLGHGRADRRIPGSDHFSGPPGPRLVHTPSEPSGFQRSATVHHSRRSRVRYCGNKPRAEP